MIQQTIQSKLADLAQAADAQSDQKPYITVAVVARSLGKSTSSIYRIDRKRGPFRFAVAGRRVLIERASFESYLISRKNSTTGDPGVLANKDKPQPRRSAATFNAQSRPNEVQVQVVKALQAGVPSSKSGCGQRELITPRRLMSFDRAVLFMRDGGFTF